jgi:catechol 2,3-dioxygenase-like lactoylglutathione lyase family enzyme
VKAQGALRVPTLRYTRVRMSADSDLIKRREAILALGAGAFARWARAAVSDSPLRFTALDHVEISVPDSAKSAALYARVFGGPIWKNNKTPRRYVKLGPAYIAIEQGREPFGVDHFSAGIEGYRIADIHSYLDQLGIAYKDYPSGKDLNVTDPDGIHVQLSADNTWSQLQGGTASPEPGDTGAQSIFSPRGLDHILLNVSDPEKSTAFYEKIFGPVARRNNNRIWFQAGRSRVGLLKVPAGQRPGVNHFCVSAASFDYDAATKSLATSSARLEKPEVADAPEFRDSDGLLVQVMTLK